jgi:hypothetical protein
MTSRSRRNGWSAIAGGAIGATCILWWTFARTEDVAAFVFSIRPGQPIYDLHFMFKRIVVVWIVGTVLAAGMIAFPIAVRRPAEGNRVRDAEPWWVFAFGLQITVLVFLTGLALTGRDPFSLDAALTSVGLLLAAVGSFWRRRRDDRS